jgi:hypothetical protein
MHDVMLLGALGRAKCPQPEGVGGEGGLWPSRAALGADGAPPRFEILPEAFQSHVGGREDLSHLPYPGGSCFECQNPSLLILYPLYQHDRVRFAASFAPGCLAPRAWDRPRWRHVSNSARLILRVKGDCDALVSPLSAWACFTGRACLCCTGSCGV